GVAEAPVRRGQFLQPEAGLLAGIAEAVVRGQYHEDPHVPAPSRKMPPRLPALVHVRLDVLLVDARDLAHGLVGQRRQVGGGDIGQGLLRVLRAGDDHAHRLVHQDPAQRELRQGRAFRHQRTQLLHRCQADLVGHAGEGLADVEGLAVAVEVAVVAFLEAGIRAELAAEHAAGQRYARDHRHAAALGLGEEQLRRAQAEHVEDDLHAGDVRVFDRLEGFLDALDAHAVARDRAALDQPLQVFEQLRVVVGVGRRAMQLQQVEGLDLQVAAAAVDPLLQVLRDVAGHLLPGQATPGLGRHERALAAALLEHARDQALGMAVAVHVGGVDEIQAGIQRRGQRGDRLAVVDRAPGRADRPGAEADLADCVAGTAESSGTHAWTPGTGRAGRQRGREKDRGAVAPDEHRIIADTCGWARRRWPGMGARLRHDPGDRPAPRALPTPRPIADDRAYA